MAPATTGAAGGLLSMAGSWAGALKGPVVEASSSQVSAETSGSFESAEGAQKPAEVSSPGNASSNEGDWTRDVSLEKELGLSRAHVLKKKRDAKPGDLTTFQQTSTVSTEAPGKSKSSVRHDILGRIEQNISGKAGVLGTRVTKLENRRVLEVLRSQGDRKVVQSFHPVDRVPQEKRLFNEAGEVVHPAVTGRSSISIAKALADHFNPTVPSELPTREQIEEAQSKLVDYIFREPLDARALLQRALEKNKPLLNHLAEVYGLSPEELHQHIYFTLGLQKSIPSARWISAVNTLSPLEMSELPSAQLTRVESPWEGIEFVERPGNDAALPSMIGFYLHHLPSGLPLQWGSIKHPWEAWGVLALYARGAFEAMDNIARWVSHDGTVHASYPYVEIHAQNEREKRSILAHWKAVRSLFAENTDLPVQILREARFFAREVERATAAYERALRMGDSKMAPLSKVASRARAKRVRTHLLHMLIVENLLWMFRPEELPKELRSIYQSLPTLKHSNSHQFQRELFEADEKGIVPFYRDFVDFRKNLQWEMRDALGPNISEGDLAQLSEELTRYARMNDVPLGEPMSPEEQVSAALGLAKAVGSRTHLPRFAEMVSLVNRAAAPRYGNPTDVPAVFGPLEEDALLKGASGASRYISKSVLHYGLPLEELAQQGAVAELPGSMVGLPGEKYVYGTSMGRNGSAIHLYIPRLGKSLSIEAGKWVEGILGEPSAGRVLTLGSMSTGAPRTSGPSLLHIPQHSTLIISA